MDKFKILWKVIPIIISFVILYILFTRVDIYEVFNAFKGANYWFILLHLLIFFLSILFLLPYKYKIILDSIKCNISYKETIMLNLGITPLAFLLPLRTGDFIKTYYLKKIKKISYKKSISSIILDNYFDGFVLILLILIGVLFNFIDKFFFNIIFLFFLFLIAIFFIFKFVKFDLFYAINIIKFKKFLFLFFIQISIWFLAFVSYYFVFKSFNIQVNFILIIFYIPIVFLISILPITFLGIGSREAAIIYFFSAFADNPALLSVGLIMSLSEFTIPFTLGLYYFRKLNHILFKDNNLNLI